MKRSKTTEKQLKTVTFYDDVNEANGQSDGQKARYLSQYALDYHVGDQAIFALQHEDGIFKTLGYNAVYKISEDASGKQTIATELDKQLGKSSMEFNQAKTTAKEVTITQ